MFMRIAGILVVLAICGSGRAEEPPPRTAALYAAHYGYAVCEYCGLVSFEVFDGFRRETATLIEREKLSEAAARTIRLRAWTDADLEWGNRGLGGFRNWCRTEGIAAAQHFVDFRNARLAEAAKADEGGRGQNDPGPVNRAP
jgi:hypothetical protein